MRKEFMQAEGVPIVAKDGRHILLRCICIEKPTISAKKLAENIAAIVAGRTAPHTVPTNRIMRHHENPDGSVTLHSDLRGRAPTQRFFAKPPLRGEFRIEGAPLTGAELTALCAKFVPASPRPVRKPATSPARGM